jgi:hypothetical protein
MKNLLVIILLVLTMASCAPMPGNQLFPGLTQPTPIEDVLVVEHTGFLESQAACTKGLWNLGGKHVVLLSCLLNACIVPACAILEDNGEGVITRCDIYTPFLGFGREHELRHCEGYSDVLY